jgi:hypothetical protein
MTPCLAAALVKFSSPSGCPNFPNAVAVSQGISAGSIEYKRAHLRYRRAYLIDAPGSWLTSRPWRRYEGFVAETIFCHIVRPVDESVQP